MIYELFYPLKFHDGWLSWLNVLRYIPFRTILATITAMLLTFILAPWFIRELRRKQIGQVVRNAALFGRRHLVGSDVEAAVHRGGIAIQNLAAKPLGQGEAERALSGRCRPEHGEHERLRAQSTRMNT